MLKFTFTKGIGLEIDEIYVANFDVRVDKILYHHKLSLENSVDIEYEIVATTIDGSMLEARKVRRLNKLSYFELWPEIVDANLSNKQRKLLETRLQQSCETAKKIEEYSVGTNGLVTLDNNNTIYVAGDVVFLDNNNTIYVAGDVVFKNNDSKVQIKIDSSISEIKWGARIPENVKICKEKVQDYLNVSKGVSEILFAATLLAGAKPFFIEAGFNPSVCVNLFGKTATYKTSLIKAFLYTRDLSKQMASLINDRKTTVIKKISNNYVFPFVLEDFHPGVTGYDHQKQLTIIDSAVRYIENQKYSAVLFITSEFLDGAESLQNRILQIETRGVNLQILSQIQNDKYLPTIVYNFLSQIFINRKAVVEDIQQQYQVLQKKEERIRIDDASVYLQIVAYLYEKYCSDEKSGLQFYHSLKNALMDQYNSQLMHLNKISLLEEDRIILDVYDMLNKSTLIKFCETGEYTGSINEAITYKGLLYISRSTLKYAMENYSYDKIKIEKILKVLSEADILKEDNNTRTTKMNGKRMYCIIPNFLTEQYNYVMKKNSINYK